MLPPAQLELACDRYDLFTLNQLKFITYTKQAGFQPEANSSPSGRSVPRGRAPGPLCSSAQVAAR
jgi:hypothetical protein